MVDIKGSNDTAFHVSMNGTVQMMDHVLVEPPSFFGCFVAAFIIFRRDAILRLRSKEDIVDLFHNPVDFDMHKVQLLLQTPSRMLHPRAWCIHEHVIVY